MRILDYKRFVSEKLDIAPVSKERLKKESNLLHIDNFWKGKKVCSELSYVLNVRRHGFSNECWVGIDRKSVV